MNDQIISKRPKFKTKDLENIEEEIKNIEWDNEPGKGVLSDEQVKGIAKSITQNSSIDTKDLTQQEIDIINSIYEDKK